MSQVRVHGPASAEARRQTTARPLLWAALAAMLPIMVALSRDFGVTWDELPRQRFGELIFEYYEGRVPIDRFEADGSRLYGGLFDFTAVALQRLLPLDMYVVRHGLNAVFGWLGIAACAALGNRFGGPWAGLLAAGLAFTAPRYFGHSMNNPKDIPFAALGAWSLFAIAAVRSTYPYLPLKVAAGLGGAIGLSLSVRPGGVLFLCYAAGVVLIALIRNRETDPKRLALTAGAFLLVTLIATSVPLPFWPWLQTRPYIGLLDAVSGVSDVGWDGRMLFNGREVFASAAPWTYVPIWMAYSIPPVVLAGAALSFGRVKVGSGSALPTLGLWFAVLFPIAYVVARGSTIYDGVRQLLFVVPPLFAVAALGWTWCLRAGSATTGAAAAAVLTVGLVEPILFQARNHPNQVVYFNPILGGPREAAGRFDLDYWGNCYFQAMQRAAPIARGARMPVVVSGRQWRLMLLNAPRVPELTVTDPARGLHHLDIILQRGGTRDVLGTLQRPDILYEVATADGTPLCVVVPGPRYAELRDRLERRRGDVSRIDPKRRLW